MRRITILALLLTSCVAPRANLSTACVRQVVRSAVESAQRASVNARAAKVAVGRAASSGGTVAALAEANRQIDLTIEELDQTKASFEESEQRLDGLQAEVNALGDAAAKASEAQRREAAGRAFWRGCAVKLGALSAGLLLWTLRKPIAAMAGVPMP